jgi:hypothetical protein
MENSNQKKEFYFKNEKKSTIKILKKLNEH